MYLVKFLKSAHIKLLEESELYKGQLRLTDVTF